MMNSECFYMKNENIKALLLTACNKKTTISEATLFFILSFRSEK